MMCSWSLAQLRAGALQCFCALLLNRPLLLLALKVFHIVLGAAVFFSLLLHIELYYISQLFHIVGVHIARLSAIDSFLRVMGPKLEAHAFAYILQEQIMATML